MKNNLRKIFELSISLGITIAFIYIFYKVIGIEKFIRFLKEISLTDFLIAFSIYVLTYITRTYRWKLTLDIKDFKKLFKITTYHILFNMFLPFRTGELSFFYMLKKENIPIKETALSFFTVRILDALSLIAVFIAAFLIFKGYYLLSLTFLMFFPVIFYIIRFITGFIKNEKFQKFHSQVLTLKTLLILYILSILTYFLKYTSFYFILPKSLKISYVENIFAAVSGDLFSILPIHGIAGIGTYEAGYVGSLLLLGVDKETALLSSVFVHIFILIGQVLVSLFCFIFIRR